jgi:hypothetical protein
MVHERRVKETGEVVELKVSGQVRLGNLIMFDTQSGSNWLQETGKSIEGDKKGQGLTEMKPGEWEDGIRWDEWQKLHPDSKVLVCEHCDKAGKS